MKKQIARILSVLLTLALLLGATVFANVNAAATYSEETTEASESANEFESFEESEESEPFEGSKLFGGSSRNEPVSTPEMEMIYEAAAIGFAHYTDFLNNTPFEYDPNILYSELLEDDFFQLAFTDFIMQYDLSSLQILSDLLTMANFPPEDVEILVDRWAVTFVQVPLMDICLLIMSVENDVEAIFGPVVGQLPVADLGGMLTILFGYNQSIAASFFDLVLDFLAQDVFEMDYASAEALYDQTQEWVNFQQTVSYYRGLTDFSYIWIASSYMKNLAAMNGIDISDELGYEAEMVLEALGIGLFDGLLRSLGFEFRHDPSKAYGGFYTIMMDTEEAEMDFLDLFLGYDMGSAALLRTALMDDGYLFEEAEEFIERVAEVFAYEPLPGIQEIFASENAEAELAALLTTLELASEIENMVAVMFAYYDDILSDILLENTELPEEYITAMFAWVLSSYLNNFAALNGMEIQPGTVAPYVYYIRNSGLKAQLAETGITIGFAEAEGTEPELVDVDPGTMQALVDAVMARDMADIGSLFQSVLLREEATRGDLLLLLEASAFLTSNLNFEEFDLLFLAGILKVVTSLSYGDILLELDELEIILEEELEEEEELLALGEAAKRVATNMALWVVDGWEGIRQDTGALFEEEDDTLDYILAWVTTLYVKDLTALNAEEASRGKSGAPLTKQERENYEKPARQLLARDEIDTVIDAFSLDNCEMYDILETDFTEIVFGEDGIAAKLIARSQEEESSFLASMVGMASRAAGVLDLCSACVEIILGGGGEGCGGDGGGLPPIGNKPVQSVSISKNRGVEDRVTIYYGLTTTTVTLTANIFPTDASNKGIDWIISNPIGSAGAEPSLTSTTANPTTASAGSSTQRTITVRTRDGNKEASIKFIACEDVPNYKPRVLPSGDATFYKGPTTGNHYGASISTIPAGTEVEISGRYSNGWLYLEYPKSSGLWGYVQANKLAPLMPVSGASFKSPYDFPNYNDGSGPHYGTDMGQNQNAPNGSTVRAVASGTVVAIQRLSDGYGYNVQIHSVINNVTYLIIYAHMQVSGFAPGLSTSGSGSKIHAGQTLGKVGDTGNSTAPHLHFEIRKPPYVTKSADCLSPKSFYQ